MGATLPEPGATGPWPVAQSTLGKPASPASTRNPPRPSLAARSWPPRLTSACAGRRVPESALQERRNCGTIPRAKRVRTVCLVVAASAFRQEPCYDAGKAPPGRVR
jgi:hypothetical protein